MDLQQVEDEFLEGGDLLDLDSREYLCPVCRRLGTTLLPALAPLPQPLLVQPDQTTAPPRGLPDQALQHSSEGVPFHPGQATYESHGAQNHFLPCAC